MTVKRLAINGVDEKSLPKAGEYATLDREWRPGDYVTVEFGLPVKMHRIGHSVAFTRGPVLLARDSRFGDGDLAAVVRTTELVRMFADGKTVDFPLECFSQDDSVRMVVSARLPLGGHDENTDRRNLATVRFCDYSSAGNRWSPSNWYRCWLPLMHDTLEALRR